MNPISPMIQFLLFFVSFVIPKANPKLQASKNMQSGYSLQWQTHNINPRR